MTTHLDSEPDVDREEFVQRINELFKNKLSSNSFLLTRQKYAQVVDQVKLAKIKLKKSASDYRRIKRYEVVNTPEGERLFEAPKPGRVEPARMFVAIDEMYDIIRESHVRQNHCGRSRLTNELKLKYINVTSESITLYISLCKPCQNKTVKRTRHINKEGRNNEYQNTSNSSKTLDDTESLLNKSNEVSEDAVVIQDENSDVTIEHPELFSRGQVDFLDVTKDPTEEYKYLMVYRDLVTRFIHLKPLKAISVDETAECLLEIFLVFGAPNILQSKNSMQVIIPICKRLTMVRPDIKVVASDAIFPKDMFKGKSNEDILRKLNDWLRLTMCFKWQQGIKYVQHTLNTTFHDSIFRTPSEAVFGSNPRKGIASFMSKDDCDGLMTDDDFEKALTEKEKANRTTKQIMLQESLILPYSFVKMEMDLECVDELSDIKGDSMEEEEE